MHLGAAGMPAAQPKSGVCVGIGRSGWHLASGARQMPPRSGGVLGRTALPSPAPHPPARSPAPPPPRLRMDGGRAIKTEPADLCTSYHAPYVNQHAQH
jgi:hypothetical protein